MIMFLVLLNLTGGDCVDDLQQLESDEGFCRIVRQSETFGLRRNSRRALEKRWRKEKKRLQPSCSSVFRYLSNFHDDIQEKLRFRSGKKAFILDHNEYLQGYIVWSEYSKLQKKRPRADWVWNPPDQPTTNNESNLISYINFHIKIISVSQDFSLKIMLVGSVL